MDSNVDAETLEVLTIRRPLVRLLVTVGKYGSRPRQGIATRRLLDELGANGLHPWIGEAEKKGYIRREKRPPPPGCKGNHSTFQLLTPKGRALVKVAMQIGLK